MSLEPREVLLYRIKYSPAQSSHHQAIQAASHQASHVTRSRHWRHSTQRGVDAASIPRKDARRRGDKRVLAPCKLSAK